MTATSQNVWIVRYGLTKFPLVENFGPYDSPLDATEGVEHAKAIGSRIRDDVLAEVDEKSSVHVYSSPFVRTAHTAQLVAVGLPGGSTVRIEEGLTEWQQSSLLVDPKGVRTFPKSKEDLADTFDTVDRSYDSLNPGVSDDDGILQEGAPRFEETEEALLKRCSTTFEKILSVAGRESFVIVSHAPCDQALAVHLEGKGVSNSCLGPWPLGGVTKFSRIIDGDDGFGPWRLNYYGETDHMPGKYKPGIKEWSLPCLSKKLD